MRTDVAAPWLLGIDMGTDSLGWAVFRLGAAMNPLRLLDGGVRLFDWGRHPKSRESLDMKRGEARRARRRLKARVWRRERLRETLLKVLKLTVLPEVPVGVWALRAEAACGPVSADELAIVLMHMARHRGFKSVRLGAEVSEKQKRESNEELGRWDEYDRKILGDMAAGKHETVGQLFAARLKDGQAVRARQGVGCVPSRALLRAEFDIIRSRQHHLGQHHLDLTAEDWEAIAAPMFEQRPLGKPDKALCSALPELGETRMPAAMPSAQRLLVRMTVANLRVRSNAFKADRRLEPAEFDALTGHLDEGGVHSWSALRKVIGLSQRGVKFSIEQDRPAGAAKAASKETRGDATTVVMKDFLPAVWTVMPLADRDRLVAALLERRHDRAGLKTLATGHGVAEDQLEDFADAVQFRLPRGTIAYGKTAVAKLLAEIAPGLRLHEAEERAFGRKHGERRDRRFECLPYYGEAMPTRVMGGSNDPKENDEARRFGRIRNVTVHIALNELRKVVNKLIDRYGCPPARIVVETTRHLSASAEELGKLRTLQAKQEKANRDDDAEIAEAMDGVAEIALIGAPQRRQRLRMYRRQERLCPYCGQPIGFTDLFGPTVHVDHVVPRSKGGPGDLSNCVVCHEACNRAKADRTPWKAFHDDPQRWSAVQDFVARLGKEHETLKRRFGENAEREDEEGFLPRADRDTSYMARVAMDYLKTLGNEHRLVDVVATRGGQTAYLRAAWGLPKWREDVAHNFVDAAVIAVTDRSLIQWLNTWHGRLGRLPREGEAEVPLPYEDFETELWAKHRRLIPSIRPDRSVDADNRPLVGAKGDLHRDLLFGLKGTQEGMARRTRKRSVDSLFRDAPPATPPKRKDGEADEAFEARQKGKPLADAAEVSKTLESFVSDRFRARFRKAMDRAGQTRPGAGLAELALAAAQDKEFGPRGVGKVRCFEDNHPRAPGDFRTVVRGNADAVIDTNNNAWMDICRQVNGKWEIFVTSRFEAAAKGAATGVDKPGTLVMRLFKRDTVAWEQTDERGQISTEYGWVKILDEGNSRFYVWPLRVSETVNPKSEGEEGMDRPGRLWAFDRLRTTRVPDRNGRSFTAESFRAAKGRLTTVTELGRLRDPAAKPGKGG